MELLAFTHHYLAYEESIANSDAYAIRRFDQWNLPSSAWVSFVTTVMALAILSDAAIARTAYVATNGYRLNVRSGPGVGYAWVNVLADGQQIDISDRTENGWVQLSDGSWVAGNYVRSSQGGQGGQVGQGGQGGQVAQVAYVATGGYRLNKRSGSSLRDGVVGSLNDGSRIELSGRQNNGWVQLVDGSWVSGNLIRYGGSPGPAPLPAPRPTGGFLQRGSDGAEVVSLQNRLRELGYFPVNQAVTGLYGAVTEDAVRAFQQRNELVVDGIAGPQTLAVLEAGGVGPAPIVSTATLERGSSGNEVTQLQNRLRNLGYFPANQLSTGLYGTTTEQAVKDFQQRNNLVANGIADPQTRAAIQSASAIPFSQIAPANRLTFGDTGPEVVRLQNRLRVLGYFPSDATTTGRYFSTTLDAVRQFQQQNGLAVSGIADPETLAILYDDMRAVSAVELLPSMVLRLNQSGPEVTRLQNRLKELNYLSANFLANGFYGPETEQAVIEFQQRNRLFGDGAAGPQTFQILYSANAVSSDRPITTVLQLESQGVEVVDLQRRLKALGYLPAAKAADGYFGLDTRQAVIDFQQKHRLPANGIADQTTQELLQSVNAIAADGNASLTFTP